MKFVLRQFFMLLLLAFLATGFARAQDVDADKAGKVKAAFVLNFIKYTEWPTEAFAKESDPIVLVVVGDDDMENNLDEVMRRGGEGAGRTIEVRRVKRPNPDGRGLMRPEDVEAFRQQLRQAHLLFVAASERSELTATLGIVEGTWTLTVSDMPTFCERGGMLGLFLDEGRIAFEANPEEISQTPLTVSSKVLKLARIVKTRK